MLIFTASIGPNGFQQKRTASLQMSMSRSNSRPSTWRSDKGYRIYIITVRRITSDGLLECVVFSNPRRYTPYPLRSYQIARHCRSTAKFRSSCVNLRRISIRLKAPNIAIVTVRHITYFDLSARCFHRIRTPEFELINYQP